MQLQTAQAQLPFVRRQLEETNRQVTALQEEGRKQRTAIAEVMLRTWTRAFFAAAAYS